MVVLFAAVSGLYVVMALDYGASVMLANRLDSPLDAEQEKVLRARHADNRKQYGDCFYVIMQGERIVKISYKERGC